MHCDVFWKIKEMCSRIYFLHTPLVLAKKTWLLVSGSGAGLTRHSRYQKLLSPPAVLESREHMLLWLPSLHSPSHQPGPKYGGHKGWAGPEELWASKSTCYHLEAD